jgi:hypothetical protein
MKKFLSVLIVSALLLTMSAMALATEGEAADPYAAEAVYVQELADITDEEIAELSLTEAETLFEQAFGVDADNFAEEEIRAVITGLSFAFKFQNEVQARKESEPSEVISVAPSGGRTRSSTFALAYSGSVGAAWVRDISAGKSPLTVSESLLNSYTLEVDYLTWDTTATLLVESGSYVWYQDLQLLLAQGATGSALSAYVIAALGLGGPIAAVAAIAIQESIWNSV